mgnify:CR=1 FL=1
MPMAVVENQSSVRGSARELLERRETGLLLVVLASSVILSLLTPRFLSINNFTSIATGMSYDVIMAIGMTLVLTVGGIDLSVGSILGLTGVVTTMLLRAGVPIPLAVLVGLSLGALLGAINGTFIAKFQINPFIVTLGMMALARGASVVLTSGYFLSNLPPRYLAIGQGKWFGIPIPIYVAGLLVIVFDYLLRNWEPFHSIFYIGTNPDTAELSGMKVGTMIIVCYVISGALSALAGVFMTSRLAMGYAQFGLGAEQRAIAASVIGGASMSGGEGSVVGAFLGVLLLAIINNGFVLLNLSVYWQGVVNGLILVLAVGVDAIRRARRGEIRD